MPVKLKEWCGTCNSMNWCGRHCAREPRVEAIAEVKALPRGLAKAVRSVTEEIPSAAERGASMAVGEKVAPKATRAQAAAGLEPAGRNAAVKFQVRMTEEEAVHLDEIRGAYSRNDALRLLLRAAEVLGL